MKVDLERIQTIDHLIRKKYTGSPPELAKRLGISVRALHNILNFMKQELSAPIIYNPIRKSYCYSEDGRLCFQYQKTDTIRTSR